MAKKKKKKIVASVGLDGTIKDYNSTSKNKKVVASVSLDGDIAPVKTTKTTTTRGVKRNTADYSNKKNTTQKSNLTSVNWANSLDDGYDLFDLSRTAIGKATNYILGIDNETGKKKSTLSVTTSNKEEDEDIAPIKTTLEPTVEENYVDTGKTYGDYWYQEYAKRKDDKIYKKGDKYYVYDPRTDSYDNVDRISYMMTEESSKKALEEAKALGYKSDASVLTRVSDQLKLDTADLTKEEHKEYEEDLLRQQEKSEEESKEKNEVKKGGSGLEGSWEEVKTYVSNIGDTIYDEVIEPISNSKESYEFGKLTEELGMESYKKMMGEENNYDEVKREHDNYIKYNADLIEEGNYLDQTFQTLPNQIGGLKSGIKGGGILGTAGAIIGGTIGAIGTKTVSGTIEGAKTGAKLLGGAGYVEGQAEYTYKLEAGLQYQTLIEMGVPEDIAKKEAQDTGAVNALIESGESILDLVTFGSISKVKGVLTKKLLKEYGEKTVTSWVGENLVKNAIGEVVEESTQEAVSIYNEKQAMEQAGLERDDSQDLERITESGIAGGFAGGLMGGGSAVITGGTKTGVNVVQNKNNTAVQTNTQTDDIAPIKQDETIVKEAKQTTQDLEKNLRQQNYQYVPKETDSIQRRTISEDASKYANNTPRTHEFVDFLVNVSEATGINFRLANNEAELIVNEKNKLVEKYANNMNVSLEEATKTLEKKTIDAYNNGDIVLNVDTPRALNRLVGHEVTHSLEGTKEYSNLQRIATEYAKTKGEYDTRIANLQDLYEGTNANVENELTSDLIGDYLFTDQEFINRIHTEDRNLFQRIYDEIKHLYRMATAGSKEARQLEQLQHSFEKAMRENKANQNVEIVEPDVELKGIKINTKNYEFGVGLPDLGKTLKNSMNQEQEYLNDLINEMSTRIVENAQLEGELGENISQNAQKSENIVQNTDDRVETNIGNVPIAEYRDIVAMQSGFDSYEEMHKEGYRIGNEYDLERLTPSQEELDNLEDIRQNKSGSEYADAFYNLEKKYGKKNLYKGLNSYNTTGKALEYSLSKIVNNAIEDKGENGRFDVDDNQEYLYDQIYREYEKELGRELTDEDFDIINQELDSKYKDGYYVADGSFSLEEYADVMSDKMNEVDSKLEDLGFRVEKSHSQYAGLLASRYYTKNGVTVRVGDHKNSTGYSASHTREQLYDMSTDDIVNYVTSEYDKKSNNTQYSLTDNKGYHYGDLGKGRDTNYFSMSNTRRSTGHFGTGTYFVGTKDSNVGSLKENRQAHEVDFTNYNLFKPNNYNEAEQLHSLLKDINNEELNALKLEDSERLFKKSNEELYKAYKKTLATAEEYKQIDKFDQLQLDSLSTVFMKELGYNGIDVRGIEGFDNGTYGSVIYDLDNTNPTSDPDIRYSLSEDTSIDDKINSSMTMDEARDMVQRTFVLNDIKNWYDDKYQNGDEWLAGEGIEEVEMYAENTDLIQYKFLNKLNDKNNGYYDDYFISDILTAYQNGTLTGEVKQDIGRVDVSKDTGYKDNRFYAPKDVTGGMEVYEKASQRLTEKNRQEVTKARAEFIINAHNKGYIESLGLTTDEVKRRLKNWSDYPIKAMELSQALNENVSKQNQWTGLENSSIVNTATISNEDMAKMVKEVKGDSNGWQRHYITSTMLALDTHIDYSPLTIDFEQGAALTQKRAAGDYDPSTDVIRIGNGYLNTVAHEIGHYIDYSWGKQLFGRKGTLSSLVKSYDKSKFTTEQIQFLEHFNEFQESIEKTGEQGDTLEYRSSRNARYWQSPTEVFARFIGKFTEWTKNQATNNRFGYDDKFYKDRFTESQYREFVKILQEKSALDTTYSEYSLSNQEQDIAPTSADIFGSEIKLQQQVQEAIAPLQETIQELNNKITTLQENIAPVEGYTDEDISLSNQRNIESLEEQNIAPIEDTSPEIEEVSDVINDPFEDRDIKAVGNRKVNAYMYENPEVKPFFQQEAGAMLGDLRNSIKGEKIWLQELNQDTGLYQENMVTGTKRLTTDDIAELLDVYHYTYAQIEKGLNAIIEDNGKENNAVSKRIEFMLNDRLLNGYKSVDGFPIPPNNEYRALIRDKNIQEYTEQAYQEWNKSINQDELAPADIEYVSNSMPKVENVDLGNDLPTDDDLIAQLEEVISNEPKTKNNEPRIENIMFADPTDIFKREFARKVEQTSFSNNKPKVTKTKRQQVGEAWGKFQEQFVNRNYQLDKYSKETGNKQIKYNADMLNSVAGEIDGDIFTAQTDNYGNPIAESLSSLFEPSKKGGYYEAFDDYLKHFSNIDRHRVGKGSVVPLEYSTKMVAEYDKTYPTMRAEATKVWKYGKNLLANMQSNGLISGQFNMTLQEMYPHYVPFMQSEDLVPFMSDDGTIRPKKAIKSAKGGAYDILGIEEAFTKYTYATKKAIRQNDLYKEIVNTSKNKVSIGADDRIDPTNLNESLGVDDKGNHYITAYVNGNMKQATISEDLYNELSRDAENRIRALEERYAIVTKPLQIGSEIRRKSLTTWSLTFIATNFIKDVQDGLLNSKYTKDFIKNYPKAFGELARAKTPEARQFLTLYGSDNIMGEYSDTYTPSNAKNGKFLKNVTNKVSKLNNIIELAPRYAEFKASLEHGANIQEAMYNAREVTTNFARGGYVTKALNRNGFTFLNASVQGFDKLFRNFSGENGAKGVVNSLTKVALYGVAPAIFNALAFGVGDDEDEDYKALPDYIKDNYYLIKTGDGEFIRIPKGRLLSIFGSAGRRTLEYMQGEEDAFEGFLTNAYSQVGVQNPLDSNVFAPLFQAFGSENGQTWYGEDLVPTRLQDKPVEEQYDESTDEFSKWLGQQIGISPYKINYVIDQYSGGIGDLLLPTITEEANSDGGLLAPIKDKFTANTTFDNKYVSEFYGTRDKVEVKANGSKATEEDLLKSKYLNSVSYEMSELYKEKREVQSDSSLTKAEKYEKVQGIQKQINSLAEEGLNGYEKINKTSNYAIVNDREYYKNADGEWWTPYEDELEELNSLGMDIDDKSSYYEAKNGIYEINEKYQGTEDTYEDRKRDIIEVVRNSDLSTDYKSYLYGKYYSEDTTNIVNMLGIDFDSYLDYESQYFVADKDEAGKSISGSKKKKVFDYINSMDIGFEEKVILAKLEYNTYDEWNYEIIDYLNNNSNITYEEEVFILKQLGFTVDEDGNIFWD